MSESRFSLESELPCVHCGTALHDEARFCFECGAPVVPELRLPDAPASAVEELRTAAYSPVSIPPICEDEVDAELQPGEPIEIESLRLDVVVEEVQIALDEDGAEAAQPDAKAITPPPPPRDTVGDPHGTVLAAGPERPMPFWPAPPKGDTVVAPPPTRPRAAG